jgi:hypothetical protein
MSNLLTFVSATIVLILAAPNVSAAPQTDVPESQQSEPHAADHPPDENLSISEPKNVGPTKPADSGYYSYRQAFTFRVGQMSDFPETKADEVIFGFQYMFPKFLSPKLEAGADVHENARGHLHVGWRWFFWERSYWRPSYKIALSHFADAEKNLATFTDPENYYVRFAGTLEYVFKPPFSVRLEPEILVGSLGQRLVITVGLSRGW